MNYLTEITGYLRENLGTEWANRVYRSANINVVDDAYSANNSEYLFSAFLLPLDITTGTTDDGLSAKIHRFGVYLFVPNSDNQDGVPAEEACETAEKQITGLLSEYSPSGGVENIQFSSAREYRYGRGYYIYEIQYQFAAFDSSAYQGNKTLRFYHAVMENSDMSYTYTNILMSNCYVDRTHGVTRGVDGLSTNNTITIRYSGSSLYAFATNIFNNSLGGHDYVVLHDDVINGKQNAIDAGYEVFEINTIQRYFDKDGNIIAVELVGN